jgi:general secretion pathway protein I
LPRATAHKSATAGFTLIEVLVALTIVAVSLSAIGALVATNTYGSHSLERHLIELELGRGIATALPDRDQLFLGSLHGDIAGHHWRVDTLPFSGNVNAAQATPWVPQTIIVTLQSPGGGALQIETVRLERRSAR